MCDLPEEEWVEYLRWKARVVVPVESHPRRAPGEPRSELKRWVASEPVAAES